MIQKALDESRIKVILVKNRKLLAKLQTDFSLGQGEAEAIALAQKERTRIVGIDDKNGDNACKLLGIAFTTAVGILLRSRERVCSIAAPRLPDSRRSQNTDVTSIRLEGSCEWHRSLPPRADEAWHS